LLTGTKTRQETEPDSSKTQARNTKGLTNKQGRNRARNRNLSYINEKPVN
jgi:hypothetical protein